LTLPLLSSYLNGFAESEQTTPCQDCPPDFLFIRYKLLAPMKKVFLISLGLSIDIEEVISTVISNINKTDRAITYPA
jgi:hypothetical protein